MTDARRQAMTMTMKLKERISEGTKTFSDGKLLVKLNSVDGWMRTFTGNFRVIDASDHFRESN